MKKIISYSLVLFIFIQVISCKKKEQNTDVKKETSQNYIVDIKNSVINWTAYKTTEKIPVKGIFKQVTISNSKTADSPLKALANTEFEIPVSSIYSKDSIRDYKLVKFFFGAMEKTLSLTGKIDLNDDGKGVVTLSMNGLTKDLSVNYEVDGNTININTSMDLDNWQAQAAIESLNKVCNEKHKAADGISKTWSDVTLNIKVKTMLQ